MILDANGMPILQPLVDNANTATFNAAFAAIGTALAPLGRTLVVGDLLALSSLNAATFEGRIVHVDEGGSNFQAQDGVWVQITPAYFTTTTLRDTAYAKASSAFKVQGSAFAFCGDLGYVTEWLNAYNSASNTGGGFVGGVAASGWHPVGDSGWATVGGAGTSSTFGANWSAAASSGFPVGSFRRLGRMIAINGIFLSSANWAGGATMFTLPPGFRPAATIEIVERVGGTINGIDIINTGAVTTNLSGSAGQSVLPLSAVFPLD